MKIIKIFGILSFIVPAIKADCADQIATFLKHLENVPGKIERKGKNDIAFTWNESRNDNESISQSIHCKQKEECILYGTLMRQVEQLKKYPELRFFDHCAESIRTVLLERAEREQENQAKK